MLAKPTAFFFPQLTSDSNGVVRVTFTMPEALTKWKFMGFAHDRSLRSGYLDGHTVTAKDLMVQPNPPRFLREGDTIEFTVKISNQSDKPQTGKARLNFEDALTGKSADQLLGNTSLYGAILTLLSTDYRSELNDIAQRVTYLDLSTEPGYMDEYMAALFLPHTDRRLFPNFYRPNKIFSRRRLNEFI
jgi:hypothetical protein